MKTEEKIPEFVDEVNTLDGENIDKAELVGKTFILRNWNFHSSSFGNGKHYAMAQIEMNDKKYVCILPGTVAEQLAKKTAPIRAKLVTITSPTSKRTYYCLKAPGE